MKKMNTTIFKFRYWNGNEMCYEVTIGKYGAYYVNGIDSGDDACLGNTTKLEDNELIMPYSNINDIKGNELWGEDIVYSSYGFFNGDDFIAPCILTVKFNGYGFYLQNKEFRVYEKLDHEIVHNAAIIKLGNSYEKNKLRMP